MLADSVLAFLSRRRDVCVPVIAIREGLHLALEDAWVALAELAELGLAEAGGGDNPVAFLSPLGAVRAGLVLNDDSTEWVARGLPPGSTRRNDTITISECDLPEDVPDLDAMPAEFQASPEEEAMVAEESEANAPERRGDYLSRPLQLPSRLLGSTAIWPVAGQGNDDGSPRMPLASVGQGRKDGMVALYRGPCGGCGSRKLGVADYCLVCCRNGQDHNIARSDLLKEKAKAS